MDSSLIAKSLSFHGQPLQKIWEGERGSDELPQLGLSRPDYSIYVTRQRNLTFQDRTKRLKLHQFIARKASVLFSENLTEISSSVAAKRKEKTNSNGGLAILPPFESFVNKNYDKAEHLHHVLGNIKPGDIVYGQVINFSGRTAATVRVICTGEPVIRYLVDVAIKAYLLIQNLIPFYDKKGSPKQLSANDFVCCEVLDISIDPDRMSLGMKGTLTIDPNAPLGIIAADQLPEYYKRSIDNVDSSYGELLEESKAFLNPNYDEILFTELGLDINENFTHMKYLKARFPPSEYAPELRQAQASKWAFRSVAEGIEHFKVGRHTEAFQCLNKALNIDPKNVEGLVARGALYANSGSFNKAVDDFETALKLNPYHANARKYMGETLVALGRSYEDENQFDKARKVYSDCLVIIPNHEEAKSSLEFLNSKLAATSSDFMLPVDTKLVISDLKLDPKKEKKIKKKKLKEKNKKRNSSSSSSSSSDSQSSSSESSSDSSSSKSSESSKTKKKKKNKNEKGNARQKSLSPLSKRLAKMDEDHPATGTTRYQFNKPFHLIDTGNNIVLKDMDYDAKVRSFLEMTQDDDNYESSVRKLLADASAHKIGSNSEEIKLGKKKEKKKKEKKTKKDKKKKKDKNIKLEGIDNMDLKEALKIIKALPTLDVESKLTSDLQKYEKNIEHVQKRQIQQSYEDPMVLSSKTASFMNLPGTSSKLHFKDEEKSKLQPSSSFSRGNRSLTPPVASKKTVAPAPPPIQIQSIMASKPEIKPFAIRPPIVLDKFGCFRLAEPLETPNLNTERKSRSISPRDRRHRSRYRSRSQSRSRSRSHHRNYRRHSRSRSPRRRSPIRRRSPFHRSPNRVRRRSPSRSPRRRSVERNRRSPMRRSRSRSESPWGGPRARGSYRGRYIRGRGRPSYFRGRGAYRGGPRSPYYRFSRSRSVSRSRSRSRERNRRSPARSGRRSPGKDTRKSDDGRWTHDKFVASEGNPNNGKKPDSEQSVEDIDKAINEAQKNRKEEIIQRDKDLLKKTTNN